MTALEDRRIIVRHIDEAHAAGARLAPARQVVGITARTLQRWRTEDGQPATSTHRADAGRRRHLHCQRIELSARAACSGPEPPPWTCQNTCQTAPAHHTCGPRTGSGLVLGHDVPAQQGSGPVVSPVPDHGPVQPQDRGLGDSRRRQCRPCRTAAQPRGALGAYPCQT